MAHRSRARLRANSVKWLLVEKPAYRSRRIRCADLLCRRNRICVHRALRAQLVSLASQAAGQSARIVLRPGLDRPIFAHDDRCLGRMAAGRRLVRSSAGNHNFPGSTRAERRMVGDFLWIARPRPCPDRDRFSVDVNSRLHNFVLANLRLLRRPPPALPGVDYLRHILECRNLALESGAFSLVARDGLRRIFHSSFRFDSAIIASVILVTSDRLQKQLGCGRVNTN